jgi:glycogen debranching enzyme
MVEHFDKLKVSQGDEDVIGLAPSVGVDEKSFQPSGYWRGPIWININWFLWRAFQVYNLNDRAELMKQDILELVAQQGFYEYYNPLNGKGIGAKNFSWTAALVIDLLSKHRHI